VRGRFGIVWAVVAFLIETLVLWPGPVQADAPESPPAPDAPHHDWPRYLVPAGTVTLANFLNGAVSRLINTKHSHVGFDTIGRNFRKGFHFDIDPFAVNFLAHPFQGSVYFSAARGYGLTFWESLPYTLLGSLEWEFFGEDTRPSFNDLITTTLSGIALGEILYRLSNLVLDNSAQGLERVLRETVAGLLSPGNAYFRLTSGLAWTEGPPPRLLPLKLEAHVGPQFYRQDATSDPDEIGPNFGVELDLRYGRLSELGATVGPYELFTMLAAARFFNGNYGATIFTNGILYGWKWALGQTPPGDCPTCTSTLLGFVQTFEYQNLPRFDYRAVALGLANHWVFPMSHGKELVTGLRVAGVPLGAVSSLPGRAQRDYTFIKQHMPLQKPGSLSDQEYLDIVAFDLMANKAGKPGDKPLTTDMLSGIKLHKK
jgi:hypothetical protein